VAALRDPSIAHVLQMSFAIALLIGGLLCIAIGAGLLFRGAATLRIFAIMNRWVSTRRVLRPLEIPRTSDLHVADSRRRWVTGLLFAVGGGYAAYRLAIGVDAARVAAAFGARGTFLPLGKVLVECIRWFLVIGCAGAFALGVVLLAFPGAWGGIESRANRWYSTRQLALTGDAMNVTLDSWVERSPKVAGVVILLAAAFPLAGAAILLFGR
jgi:hypothetical protein